MCDCYSVINPSSTVCVSITDPGVTLKHRDLTVCGRVATSTDEATIISLFADSASPSSSSRNHLTALVLLVVLSPILFCPRLRKFHFPRNALRIGIFRCSFQPGPPSLSAACVPAVIPSLFPMCFTSSQGRESCSHAETGERARGACVQRYGQGRERDDMHACMRK